jgi:hypothetical protein
MKHVFLLLAFFASADCFSQVRTFYGRVIDNNKQGIPFAIVHAKEKSSGVYCDEAGRFVFTANTDSVKTIIFSCLGYEKKERPVSLLPTDSIFIELKQNNIVLHEYSVKATGNVLGKRNLSHTGDSYGRYGSEHAIYLKAKNIPKKATINTVYVYITDEGLPDTKFRIHVYSRDEETGMPSKELTDTNVIVHATKGNEWVTADLSNKGIQIKTGVFVSVEWVAMSGNSTLSQKSRRHASANEYNGQVLGLTNSYGSNSKIFSRRVLENGDWFFFDCKAKSRYNKCDIPMIYCTYNTPKK